MDIAIITGASSGLGREFLYQANKWINVDEVWVISRNEKDLQELVLISAFKLRIIPLDLSKEFSLKKLKELIDSKKPNIKLLINSAGYGKMGEEEKIDLEDDLGMINLNDKALVAITRYSLPYMKEKSTIIQIASRAAYQPLPYMATYAASKAFVLRYSEALAVELKPRKIRVLAVTPSYVKTKWIDRANSKENDKLNNFGKFFEAKNVVKKAYHDAYKTKKLISALGFRVRFTRFLMRIIPDKLAMKIYLSLSAKKNKK